MLVRIAASCSAQFYIRGNNIRHTLLKRFHLITFDINTVKHGLAPVHEEIQLCSPADP